MAIQLTCLGTGDAFGSGGRHCAGYLVDAGESRILLDAGPGILSALRASAQEPESIDAVFLSHLHGDHFCGVAFLLLQATIEQPRHRPLTIVGPPGTRERIAALYAALYPSRAAEPFPFPVHHVAIGDGEEAHAGAFTVAAFRVPHQRRELSLGFRVGAADRVLVYSGDTAWTPDLVRHAAGADLFLCECTAFDTPLRGHIRYVDLAAHRASFDCGSLLLTHLGREMAHRVGEIPEPLARDGAKYHLGGI